MEEGEREGQSGRGGSEGEREGQRGREGVKVRGRDREGGRMRHCVCENSPSLCPSTDGPREVQRGTCLAS